MLAKKATAKIPTDAEIDRASLDEIRQISTTVARDVLRGTITPKEGNAISIRVGRRLEVIEQELRSGATA
jgi:hypothetical protein